MIHVIQRQAPVTGDAVCHQERCPANNEREVLSLQQFPLSPKTLGKPAVLLTTNTLRERGVETNAW